MSSCMRPKEEWPEYAKRIAQSIVDGSAGIHATMMLGFLRSKQDCREIIDDILATAEKKEEKKEVKAEEPTTGEKLKEEPKAEAGKKVEEPKKEAKK